MRKDLQEWKPEDLVFPESGTALTLKGNSKCKSLERRKAGMPVLLEHSE